MGDCILMALLIFPEASFASILMSYTEKERFLISNLLVIEDVRRFAYLTH